MKSIQNFSHNYENFKPQFFLSGRILCCNYADNWKKAKETASRVLSRNMSFEISGTGNEKEFLFD